MIKPILFNTEMVRTILAGKKTVTRRVVKPCPVKKMIYAHDGTTYGYWMDTTCQPYRLPYRPCDILYVRETWGDYSECQPGGAGYYLYRADYPDGAKTYSFNGHICDIPRWHPSIHMPREAARLFLRVTDVRVERLQDISIADAQKEGCDGRGVGPSSGTDGTLCTAPYDFSIERFQTVWDSTIKKTDLPLYGWDANPWVWVIEFERCENPMSSQA